MPGPPETRPTKQRPYLLRAMHQWMVDNGLTPHIVVDATRKDVLAPAGYAKDGKLVLNVSYSAARALDLGNDRVSFEARFGGVPRRLDIPIDAVLGIYARESGRGMLFPDEDAPEPPDSGGPQTKGDSSPGRPPPKKGGLKVVK
ncbi:MAG TPA: ClpXP protease specificity-enhancing factor [Gammaproteobacteria bacterium]|nr:ClpXP protease specificity-enhancing factor [Gammaproteobacteria bacterium]